MRPRSEQKFILIVRQTRLNELVTRFNTVDQARFYIESLGNDFSDYVTEHETYEAQVLAARAILGRFGRLQVLRREYLTNFIFGPKDMVFAIGQDGLVANSLKYLRGQPLIGLNPDPDRWDGILLPFSVGDLEALLPALLAGEFQTKDVTMGMVELNDGQSMLAVNDFFIGQKTHVSSRYAISFAGNSEIQSSSGIIVSTGLGSTGWMKSVLTGAAGIAAGREGRASQLDPATLREDWSTARLTFSVREPYPSNYTGADIVFGRITTEQPLELENGVIFSDGIESDYLNFNSGITATVRLAELRGKLVVG
mgnify:CR=1 FL=1